MFLSFFFFFSSRRRHTRLQGDWSSDVCSSDLLVEADVVQPAASRRVAKISLEVGDPAGGEETPRLRVERQDLRVLARVAPQPLDAFPDHLERLRERVLGLRISERRDAPGKVQRDEEGQAERGNQGDEKEERQEPLAKGTEHPQARPSLARSGFLLARELPARRADLDSLAVADGHGRNAGSQISGETLDPLG